MWLKLNNDIFILEIVCYSLYVNIGTWFSFLNNFYNICSEHCCENQAGFGQPWSGPFLFRRGGQLPSDGWGRGGMTHTSQTAAKCTANQKTSPPVPPAHRQGADMRRQCEGQHVRRRDNDTQHNIWPATHVAVTGPAAYGPGPLPEPPADRRGC